MDESELRAALATLDQLAVDEYQQSLDEVVADPDPERAARRIGRLGGVLLKEPFATRTEHDEPSVHNQAYTSYKLFPPEKFEEAARTKVSEFRLLEAVYSELAPGDSYLQGLSTYQFAEDAQAETGFFGYFARALRPYVCGDAEIRKTVDEAVASARSSGVQVVTPETLVTSGGLSLGVYLVDTVPFMEYAGAPLVAVTTLTIYKLGVQRFCNWTDNLRTDSDEKRRP